MTKAIPGGVDAGCVRVRLDTLDGVIAGAIVSSERPEVARVLCGKPADAAVALVPLIFAVCGRAQGRAAAMALAAAQGVETPPRLDAAVVVEVLREHLWRMLLDLPPLLGLSIQRKLFAGMTRAIQTGDRPALQVALNQSFWNELLTRLDAQVEPTVPDGSRDALLPVMSAAQSLTIWPRLNPDFARLPQWQGAAAETGAYARWQGQNPANAKPLAARWHARCAEVWSWAAGDEKVGAGGTASAVQVAPGIGRALVETARGLLIHEICVVEGRIADYQIVAPTEWNFHPQGILAEWLTGGPADAGFVSLAVAALDPCVRLQLDWVQESGPGLGLSPVAPLASGG